MIHILQPYDSVTIYPDGTRAIRGLLVSDETPASLSLTGEDVEELNDDDVLDIGCLLRTPDKKYMAFEEGEFTELE